MNFGSKFWCGTRRAIGAGLLSPLVAAGSWVWPEPALSSESWNRGISVGVGIESRQSQKISYADFRPVTEGEIGGRIELGYWATANWRVMVSGHLAGSWLTFGGPAMSGKITDASWVARIGADRAIARAGCAQFSVGGGAEYGEVRSWLDGPAVSDEGPRTFLGGGYLKLGGLSCSRGRISFYAEVIASSFRAHSRQARLLNDFDWLGQALEGGAGLRVHLGSKPYKS